MPFLAWVPNAPVFAQSAAVAPAAAANTNGAPYTIVPAAGYTGIVVLHIGVSNFGVAAETVTTTVTGTFFDGSQVSNNNTYTTNAGDMDNQHFLEPAWGITAAAGQSVLGKILTQLQTVEQSTIPSSAASQTIRVWGYYV